MELYGKVKGAATQGRTGLGRSSLPRKVAGVRWAGKRTKLDSDSEEGDGYLPCEQGENCAGD